MVSQRRREQRSDTIDNKRIYTAGFSNGGFFTLVLWTAHPEHLAAVGLCGCNATPYVKALKPKPCLHVAGQNDPVVSFDFQEKSMENVRKLNGCAARGQLWNKGVKATATFYPSKLATPFVSVIHSGGHEVPPPGGRLITRFFKEEAKP